MINTAKRIKVFQTSLQRRWLFANILGWPVALYLGSFLVSIVDSPFAIVLGGLVVGICIGVFQGWALRDSSFGQWVGWSAVGGMAGGCLTVFAGLIGLVTGILLLLSAAAGPILALLCLGVVFGLGFGGFQAILLQRESDSRAFWWIIANAAAAGLCGVFSLPSTSLWLPIICSPGPLIFALITGLALWTEKNEAP